MSLLVLHHNRVKHHSSLISAPVRSSLAQTNKKEKNRIDISFTLGFFFFFCDSRESCFSKKRGGWLKKNNRNWNRMAIRVRTYAKTQIINDINDFCILLWRKEKNLYSYMTLRWLQLSIVPSLPLWYITYDLYYSVANAFVMLFHQKKGFLLPRWRTIRRKNRLPYL